MAGNGPSGGRSYWCLRGARAHSDTRVVVELGFSFVSAPQKEAVLRNYLCTILVSFKLKEILNSHTIKCSRVL